MTTMDEAHRRDYAAKDKMDTARRAIVDLLDAPEAEHRLGAPARVDLLNAKQALEKAAAQIVAAWD